MELENKMGLESSKNGKKSETEPVSPVNGKGNRRWIAGYVDDLMDALTSHPNLSVENISKLIGGLRAMLLVFSKLSEHYVPITPDRRVIENPNRPPKELVDNDGNTSHLVLPVVPMKTILMPLIENLTNNLKTFNDENNIEPKPSNG